MKAARIIPNDARRLQIDASNPDFSAWVAANAGSGKTHVLAQRVIRLLLDGVKPERILCITFTKAASANMANRVFNTLSGWTALDDDALDQAIREISHARPDAKLRALARRLFATALETPGGLKVQTIHAFCTRLLHQFPFEANVAARFNVLDDTSEKQLLDQIGLTVLINAAAASESATGRALSTAVATVADQTFRDVIGEAIRKRDKVRRWLDAAGGVAAAITQLSGTLGIAANDTLAQVETAVTEGPLLPPSEWAAVAAALRQGSKTDQEQAARLATAMRESGGERAGTYLAVFFTKEGPRRRVVTRSVETREPALYQKLVAEQQRLMPLTERRRAVYCRDRSAALITVADEVLRRYRTEKDRRGLLDYDDLIDKTLALLINIDAAWVHYKLDRGIDHVLIDEAQDTSPKQWDIVRKLVSEFFAGAGARVTKRTLFVVGDEKQSIFSFQGAAPHAFAENRRFFELAHERANLGFVQRAFTHSFRSGPVVLGAVDEVFRAQSIYRSVTSDAAGVPAHEALPEAVPGIVEIWPLIEPEDREEIEAWDAPFDSVTETSPQVRLAQKIANNVKRWTQSGLRPGDVLVLVRQRGPLFEAVIRALKDKGVAVAGADRLVLTEHIAVMDLMALGDALLLPEDDLALATVLKSPLFGLDDDDLFALAWERKGSLRRALRVRADNDPRFASIAIKLDRFSEAARNETPFAFYAHMLGREHGRRLLLARLGAEANDALDEFLNLALDYENRETASLQGFLAWLRASRTDVKRDMEITRDEVRVMTVHGAKGLEAPIVVLADTTTPPAGPSQRQPRVLTLAPVDAAPDAPEHLVWVGAKALDVAVVATARERARVEAEDEYRRLLYVAMTRTAERLVICGAQGERGAPDGCWYDLVTKTLLPLSTEEPADDGDGTLWRYRHGLADTAPPTVAATQMSLVLAPARPVWLGRDAPRETSPSVQVSPSQAYDAQTAASGPGRAARELALRRGVLMHRLLQSLPDIAPEARANAARQHLARAAHQLSVTESDRVIGQVLGVLDDPRFAPLFAPGSRAEVPIVGRIARAGRPPLIISGQVDRLSVTDEAILIADYKTNHPAPRTPADVPQAYVVQLALYRAMLARLYPERSVRAALLWTDVPDLMEISEGALESALAAVTSA